MPDYTDYHDLVINLAAQGDFGATDWLTNRIALKAESISVSTTKNVLATPLPFTGIVFGYESDVSTYEKAVIHVEGTSGNVDPNFHVLLHDGANNTNATLDNAAKFNILNDGHIYGECLINSNVNPTGENSGKMWSTSGTWTSIWNVGSDPEGVRYFIECDIQGLDGYTSHGFIYKDRNGRWSVNLQRQAGTNVQVDASNTYIQVTQSSGANQTNSSGNVRLTRLMGTGATAVS